MRYSVDAKYTEVENWIKAIFMNCTLILTILIILNLVSIFLFGKQILSWIHIVFFSIFYGQIWNLNNKKVIATIPFKIDENTMIKILKRNKFKFEVSSEKVIKIKMDFIALMMKLDLIIRILDNKVEIEGAKYMVENIIGKIENIN
ncbi:MAG: hypothetical protein E6940_14405 [Clostridium septicum]|uniref:hypothetical protein n=1 Tax=Clostridium septicum TaxID=1504 RepID=UPI00258AC7CB|nr:hypothetical protein [Clostridium septicum]MDU1315226.1 hypothetical protein [Clostridium septicum]